MHEAVAQLETDIRALGVGDGGNALHTARTQVRACLCAICGLDVGISGDTLAGVIERAANASTGRREAASVILRCLGVRDLIPENNPANQINRKIISLIQAGASEIWSQHIKEGKPQNFKSFNIVKPLFNISLQEVEELAKIPAQIDPIIANRQRTTAVLNDKLIFANLAAYDSRDVAARVETIYALLSDIQKVQDTAFPQKILNLQNLLLVEQT